MLGDMAEWGWVDCGREQGGQSGFPFGDDFYFCRGVELVQLGANTGDHFRPFTEQGIPQPEAGPCGIVQRAVLD